MTAASKFTAELPSMVEGIFSSMLHCDVSAAPDSQVKGEVLTASIFFAGGWNGALFFVCSAQLARSLAERLMRSVPGSEHDTHDAMGELANMVGGNLKAMMPLGVTLSLPSVVHGSDYAVKMCGNQQYSRLGFQTLGERFWITLWHVPN